MLFRLPVSHPARLLTAGMIAASLALGAFCLAQEGKPEPPKKKDTAGQRFKNIKVLKDLPADALIPVMQKFDAALGVRCDYCHVAGKGHSGFEKDDKPEKEKARQMILMSMDINKKYKTVKNKVTCYTCHQGQQEPPSGSAEK